MVDELKVDVVIVGAGPAGSTTARFAAEAGVDVLVLERRAKVGVPVRCGEFMPSLEEMTNMFPDVGDMAELFEVPADLVSLKCDVTRIYSPKFTRYELPFLGYTTDRDRLDQFYASQAEKAGARIMTGQKVVEVKEGMVRTDDLIVKAKVIVGADGPMSMVGKAFGLPRSADLCPAVTTQVKGDFEPVCEMYFGTIAPGGYAWVIPKKGAANVGLGVDRKFGEETVNQYFNEFVKVKGLKADKPEGKFVPMSMPCKRTVSGQAITVGDAAGQVMAVNGGGIPIARLAGRVAGKAVAENVLKGTSLQKYDEEWRRQFYRPLRTAARTKVLAGLCFGSAWRTEMAMKVLGDRRMNNLIRCRPIFP
ncbi:MAG: NAD(P)/FAD-dependent oxidoreductase [Methanomassiliicoccales archaeon]|nr:NAD(P)/FAD-dependent oxidoreductase [Methanomassiliicoccales archaeon]